MRLFSPRPRFRIHSEWKDYVLAGKELLFGYKAEDARTAFERAVADKVGAAHAVCMPQARVGIYLALRAVIQPGAEVILSPNTIADVINMVILSGAKPVFCDIDPATGNLDAEAVEALITPQTRAIFVTHLYGLASPMQGLRRMCEQHGLALVEDAAQAFGATRDGTHAGMFGDAGVFSFGMAKNLMAFWGGMIVTNRADVAEFARGEISRWRTISRKKLGKKIFSCFVKDVATLDPVFAPFLFPIFRMGYRKNIRSLTRMMESELDLSRKTEFPDAYQEQLSPLQARIALSKLHRLETDFAHRLACARLYHDGLKDIEQLTLPPMLEDGSHVYNYYPVGCDDRVDFRLFLLNQGRDVALQHIRNTADLPAFKDFYRDCPHTRRWAMRTLMFPNYSRYPLTEVEKNVAAIRTYFGR